MTPAQFDALLQKSADRTITPEELIALISYLTESVNEFNKLIESVKSKPAVAE